MLARLRLIFLRYAERTLSLSLGGQSLSGPDGPLGEVTRIALERNRLLIEGRLEADRVGVTLNRTQSWTTPERGSGQDKTTFRLDIPFETGLPHLLVDRAGKVEAMPLPGFTEAQVKRARARLWGPYIWAILGLAPEIYRWKRLGDMGAREVVKERLGLVDRSNATEMRSGPLLTALPVPARPFQRVTVIMPIYNAFDVLPEALERLARHSALEWRVILIEDCSSDPQVRPFVKDWAARPEHADRVTLLLNEANLGFIGSVNRGFDAAQAFPKDPVVLLNSDALVPQGWDARLLALLDDPEVASVTPMSNDAEIFTVPVICQRTPLAPGMAEILDQAAARLHPQENLVCAPTGVGFCMALSPSFLAKIPQFDTSFGRGYGEETDWCQKARALGGKHVCAQNLFVEHRGGESFGSADKQKLLERNCAEIARRYPAYDQEVQDFLADDPLNTVRLALGLTWAAEQQDSAVPVYLAHAMGGGAEHYLQTRIEADLSAGGSAVVVRVGQGYRWKVELHCARGVTQGLTNEADLMQALIAHLPRRRIVYSCGVGVFAPLELPQQLLAMAGQDGTAAHAHKIEILFHDFYPVSPSYTLLNAQGRYQGVPCDGAVLAQDPAHQIRHPEPASLSEWQAAWRPLMAAAERIIVFSQSSRAIVVKAYPESANAIVVQPHALPSKVPVIASGWDGTSPPVIGVLGNIGYQKGAAVLQELSRDLARDPRAGLVVIGQIDPDYGLAVPAKVHGSYQLRDLPGLVARYQIAAWLIPSIWPETFSFTTHEALATGLPVFCFDLGAQGDAVAAALEQGAQGAVLPLPGASPMSVDVVLQTLNATAERPAK